jgi:iron complex outermembrane receptor protein
VTQNFKLPGKITCEVSALYVSATRVGLSLRKSWGSVSAGIQKTVNDRSKLHLTVTDIFWTRNSVYLTNNPVLGQMQQTSYYNEPRVLRISYTLNFGNTKIKAGKPRTTASENEQQRMN